jgi:uncharacterized protein YihD (DUF1040 family)
MAHKQLFNNNPVQNAMSEAYQEMLKEETNAGIDGNTANFFEDILTEATVEFDEKQAKKIFDVYLKKAKEGDFKNAALMARGLETMVKGTLK